MLYGVVWCSMVWCGVVGVGVEWYVGLARVVSLGVCSMSMSSCCVFRVAWALS